MTQQPTTTVETLDTPTRGWRAWLPTIGLLGVAVLLPALGALGLAGPIRGAADVLHEQAGWTMPLFVLAAALLAGVAILPTHAVSLAAGYVYGLALGLPAAMVAVLAASGLGYALAGRLSNRQLRGWIDRHPTGQRLAANLIDAETGRAILVFTLARLPPQVPFAFANVLAAMLSLRLVPFLIGTAVGMLPRVALVVYLGSQLAAWDAGTTSTEMLVQAVASALIGLIGLSWLAWRACRLPADPNVPQHA
ncbi:TVP38/TMEM64 family protein [Mucisphaera sp.]|uniref:TVP38/TMEM64 family protein n=1 Tax=Mucisphaera sp. TaxID=2913024 RepID=UPI003D145FDD